MRLKDAASCSFDCFNIDLKERPDDKRAVGAEASAALDVSFRGPSRNHR